ncbi:VOC family protein [Rhizobium sp. YJ-22]|uniref:VOC family protein n=1 Tax=Rhizobium sp. YJ-22 TaxID=3037556 RepID=UPI00241218C9|nr:VOC family protein [Rhizobium sp. YJ-22]MDG3575593.1 VOC family protein [Rhizobium sp. YJ-22]
MANPNLFILYVKDPAASARFYRKLLGREPAVAAPNFVAFPLDGEFTLGLWRQEKVEPPTAGGEARSEVAFMIPGDNAIAKTFEDWKAAGHEILQPLTVMDFGPTFVIADPDGHRLRVCEPDKE